MTGKRFEICDVDLYEYGMPLNEILDNGVPLSQNQVCRLLNELYEENEQLKTLNIPLDEVEEIVVDYKKRVKSVYYND